MKKESEKNEFRHYLKFVLSSSTIVLAGMFLAKILNYAYKIIIAKEFGPEVFGLFSLALMVTGWFIAIAGFGIPEGLLRYIPLYSGKKKEDKLNYSFRTSLKFLFFSSIVSGIILFLLAEKISLGIFHDADLIPFLKLFSLAIPITILAGPYMDALLAFEKPVLFSVTSNIAPNLIKVFALVLFILVGLKSSSIIYSHLLGIFGTLILAYILCAKAIPILVKKYPYSNIDKKKIRKEIWGYSWPLMFLGLISSIFYWIDSFFIGYFQNAYDVGIYNAAVPIALLLTFFPSLVMTVLFPVINKEYGKKKFDVIRDLSKQVGKWIFILNIPLLVAILIFPEFIIGSLFTPEFFPAKISLILLAIGSFTYSLGVISFSLISMLGKSKMVLGDFIVATVFNIILNIILVPTYGIAGASFATMLTYILLTGILFAQTKKYLNIIPLRRKVLRSIFAIIVPAIILIIFREYAQISMILFLISLALYFMLYLIILFLLRCLDEDDLFILKALKEKFRKRKQINRD